jgi:cell division septation protein DedD
MSDIRAGDEDRLPWLEAVDEDDDNDSPSAAKLIAFVVIGLVAIGLIVGGLFWMGNRAGGGDSGEPETIAADSGDYKEKPADAGGMKVEGEGQTAFAASEGAEPKGTINTSAMPEAPVTAAAKQPPAAAQPAPPGGTPKAAPTPTPKPAQKSAAATPAPATPATSGGGGGATIQLGAFDSAAAANGVWKTMSGRFKYLAPLNHSVMTANVKGKTYYRLRASGPDASGICGRLKVAGETCITVN